MTIKIPSPTLGDRILSVFGKKRGFIVPRDSYDKFGPYAYVEAKRESFWKVLFRPKSVGFPENVVDEEALRDLVGGQLYEPDEK